MSNPHPITAGNVNWRLAMMLENALALTPLACIIAAAAFVEARNGYQADKQRIDEPRAIHASQGAFA